MAGACVVPEHPMWTFSPYTFVKSQRIKYQKHHHVTKYQIAMSGKRTTKSCPCGTEYVALSNCEATGSHWNLKSKKGKTDSGPDYVSGPFFFCTGTVTGGLDWTWQWGMMQSLELQLTITVAFSSKIRTSQGTLIHLNRKRMEKSRKLQKVTMEESSTATLSTDVRTREMPFSATSIRNLKGTYHACHWWFYAERKPGLEGSQGNGFTPQQDGTSILV